jgi:hypothetical protein
MKKCHYIQDIDAGKVLIPGCWPVVNSGRMEDCTCRDCGNYPDETFKQYESRLYREKIKQYIDEKSELQKEIKELEKENAALNRVIKRLCKNKAVAKPKPA